MSRGPTHRINTNPDGGFDEVWVKYPRTNTVLLHAEMMNSRSIFVAIGPMRIWAYVNKDGKVEVTHTERDDVKEAKV